MKQQVSQKILVTGADGFIGSHLVNELVTSGYKVRAFCLYNSFQDIGWLKDLPQDILANLEIVFGDIRDFDSINQAVKGRDAIFHLAALIAIPYSYTAPMSYVDVNIKGTLNILRSAVDNGIGQVIHTSSSEVYGTAQYIPMDEKHPLVGQSPYAATKIGADQIAHSFYCSYGLPVSTVRPFNAFGPRQSLRAVIPTIISQVIAGNKKIKLGNVDTTRDFTFVLDTVKGMKSFLGKERTFGEVINLGTGVEVTIREIVNLVADIAQQPIEIDLDEDKLRPQKSEVERLCASNKKAKDLLDWSPQHSFRQGLELTYNWFKDRSGK